MNPMRQPVGFLKSFDHELRSGQLTKEAVKQKIDLLEANVDTIVDILQDNILNALMGPILNRSWQFLADERAPIPQLVKKIQQVAANLLNFEEALLDEIVLQVDEVHVLATEALLNPTCPLNPSTSLIGQPI